MSAKDGQPRAPIWVREPNLCALAAITLIGLALRIDFLFQPMRYDESYNYVTYIARPLRTTVSYYDCPNNHILHTLMARACIALFGVHPWAQRLPALIFGTLMIPAAYFMATAFFGPNVAIVTAALTASSSILVEYSTNARGYTVVCVCFMVILAIAKSLALQSTAARWRLFSIIAALGFYTIPVMLFPFGIVVVWVLLNWLKEDTQRRDPQLPVKLLGSIALTAAIVLVLYIPVLANTGWRSLVANRFVTPQANFFRKLIRSSFSTWALAIRDLPRTVVAVLVVGLGTSVLVPRASRGDALRLIAAIILWCSTILLIIRAVPNERVWLFMLPLGFALGLDGLGVLARVNPGPVALAALLIVAVLSYRTNSSSSIVSSRETGALPDAQAMTMLLKPLLSEKCHVLTMSPSDSILEYYFDRSDLSRVMVVTKVNSDDRDCLFAVTNLPEGQSLDDVLSQGGVERPELKRTTLIAHYETGNVYKVELAPEHSGTAETR